MLFWPHPILNKTVGLVGQKKKLFYIAPSCVCSKCHVFDWFLDLPSPCLQLVKQQECLKQKLEWSKKLLDLSCCHGIGMQYACHY